MVTLTNCTFVGNSAVGTNGTAGNDASGGGTIGKNGGNGTAGVQALGGAIYNLGGLTICNCSFLTNSAAGGSGGSGGDGGDGTFQGGNGGNGGVGRLRLRRSHLQPGDALADELHVCRQHGERRQRRQRRHQRHRGLSMETRAAAAPALPVPARPFTARRV